MEFYYDKFIMEMHFCYRSEFKNCIDKKKAIEMSTQKKVEHIK